MKANPPIPEGTKFGYLTVLSKSPKIDKRIRYTCECQCGNKVSIRNDSLISGRVKSCGCLHDSYCYNKSGHHTTHGMSHSTEYNIYMNMLARCYNPNNPDYLSYGGRGITVCPEWLGADGFSQFMKDVGRRPSKSYSLDRTNNGKGYSPHNVIWQTAYNQVHNRRTVSDLSTFSDNDILDALRKFDK